MKIFNIMIQFINTHHFMLLLLIGLTTYVISLSIVPLVIAFVRTYDLLDVPNNRKMHEKPTPSMGGIAVIIAVFSTSIIAAGLIGFGNITFILLSFLGFGVLGFLDDWKDLSAKVRLLCQVLFGSIAFTLDIRLDNFYGFLGIHELSQLSSFILTVGFIVLVINAYNLIDGIDTLAGGLITINLGVFTAFFMLTHNLGYALISVIAIGAVMGFLKYNLHPAKIFLGDSGSLPLGMLMAVFTLKALSFLGGENHLIVESNWLIPLLVAINAVPVLDTLRVFTLRILKGRSPFSADKNHLHHIYLKNDFGHLKSALAIHFTHLVIIVFSFWIGTILPLSFAVLCVLVVSLLLFEANTAFRISNNIDLKQRINEEKEGVIRMNRLLKSLNKTY